MSTLPIHHRVPHDVWQSKIFLFLDFHQFAQTLKVCRAWKAIGDAQDTWLERLTRDMPAERSLVSSCANYRRLYREFRDLNRRVVHALCAPIPLYRVVIQGLQLPANAHLAIIRLEASRALQGIQMTISQIENSLACGIFPATTSQGTENLRRMILHLNTRKTLIEVNIAEAETDYTRIAMR